MAEYTLNRTQNTTTITENTNSLHHQRSGYSLVIETVVIILLAILNSVGNISVFLSILRALSLRKRIGNALVASLAVSDFFMVAEMIFRLVIFYDAQAAVAVCDVFSGVLVILTCVTILHLAALSCDRYVAIVYPLRYPSIVTARTMKVILPVLWVLPVFPIAFSPLHTTGSGDAASFRSSSIGCPSSWKKSPISHHYYVLALVLLLVGLPLVIMLVCYGRIARISYHQARRIVEPELQDSEETAVTQERKKKRKNEMKWAKTLGIVNGTFIVSYVPVFTVSVVRVKYGLDVMPYWLRTLGIMVLFLNSALNPVIYSFRSRQFREAFLGLLGRQPTPDVPQVPMVQLRSVQVGPSQH